LTNSTFEYLQQDTVYAFAQSTDTLYAARASGLYRSSDGGNTWEDALASLDKTESFAAASVAIYGNTAFSGVKGAVLRSDDAGESWHIAGLPSPPPLVVALAISPNNAEVIAAGTAEDGVFVSTDRGTTWGAWNFGLIDLSTYSLVISPNFEQDRTIFVGTESGVFRSHNGGRAWRETAFSMDAAPVLSLAISSTSLYAGTEENGLFASDDFGVTWRQVENDLISGAVNTIQISASEISLLLNDKIVHSSDNGHSWNIRHAFSPDQMAMTMLQSSDTIVVGFADGEILQLR
jgi:photosystem II stability/assembly factor-like uncharacterized protein